MENKKQDPALQTPAEANRDKHVNYFAEEEGSGTEKEEGAESRRRNSDSERRTAAFNEMLQNEMLLDPGNEHHHRTDADDKIFDSDIDRSPRYEADAEGDERGNT